jgi:tRNA dimethylallyltransferase
MSLIAVLAGPTASGKSALAVRWAQQIASNRPVAIISADSRQIYRDFRVGTGTPTEEEQQGVPHHLLGFLDPMESYSPRRFRVDAEAAVASTIAAHPDTDFLVVGGTGLYLREWMYPGAEERGETPRAIREAAAAAIATSGLDAVHADLTAKDPEGMNRVDPHDAYRITKRLENWLHTGRSYAAPKPPEPLNPLFQDVPFLWLEPERKELHRRIEARAEAMFRNDWVLEVLDLMQRYDPMRTPAFNAIGYREIAEALTRGKDPEALIESVLGTVVARTRQYAKKQVTFFRHQFPKAVAFEPEKLEKALAASGWDASSIPTSEISA